LAVAAAMEACRQAARARIAVPPLPITATGDGVSSNNSSDGDGPQTLLRQRQLNRFATKRANTSVAATAVAAR